MNKIYKFIKNPIVSGIFNASVIILCISEIANQTSNIWLMILMIMLLATEFLRDYSDSLQERIDELEDELQSLDEKIESNDKDR